jgi:hypothetical protein
MKVQVRLLSLLIALWAVGISVALGQKKDCPKEGAKEAEMETDNLKTWDSMYRFYRRFAQCDDGAIGEGVSDNVAKLRANHWPSIGELVRIGNRDRNFEKFVLRHVDETIDWSHDAPKIRENARLHCPSDSKRLCAALIARATPQKQ